MSDDSQDQAAEAAGAAGDSQDQAEPGPAGGEQKEANRKRMREQRMKRALDLEEEPPLGVGPRPYMLLVQAGQQDPQLGLQVPVVPSPGSPVGRRSPRHRGDATMCNKCCNS